MRPEGITRNQWIRYNYYLVLEHFIGLKNSERYIRPKRNKLYQEILENNDLEGRGTTVDVRDIERDNFEPYANNKKELANGPLVFRGAAKDWPCVQKWSKDYFRERFANYQVSLVGNPGLVGKDKETKFEETNLADFIDNVSKDKRNYLRFSRIVDELPELRQDIEVSWLDRFKSRFSRGGYLYMFMGEAGSKTYMHSAIIQSLFIQIRGQKKWTIYAPNERIFLDIVADRRPYYYTHAIPDELDDPKFPLLKYAKKYEITLDEGDVLWFPSYYWHYVENLTPNIGVTYKWTDLGQSFRLSSVLTCLYFLATKPWLISSFLYNTFKKKDLLFEKKVQVKEKVA